MLFWQVAQGTIQAGRTTGYGVAFRGMRAEARLRSVPVAMAGSGVAGVAAYRAMVPVVQWRPTEQRQDWRKRWRWAGSCGERRQSKDVGIGPGAIDGKGSDGVEIPGARLWISRIETSPSAAEPSAAG